ncbi:hypothetical protein SMICM17S_01729 [Streptomyces microflavus]
MRLGDVAGLSRADAGAYAGVLIEALGPVAERPLDLPPLYRTFLSDDHTPVEYSLSFQAGRGAARCACLLEPGCADGGQWPGTGGPGCERCVMARRWSFAADRLDGLRDLFLPPSPQGPWLCGARWSCVPGGVPR